MSSLLLRLLVAVADWMTEPPEPEELVCPECGDGGIEDDCHHGHCVRCQSRMEPRR